MKSYHFKNAAFVKTAFKPKDYPTLRDEGGTPLPEIAVVGRSNVGKSSLLNNLFQSHKLVKTSSTPGKTQALNFFSVDTTLSFVDLPGYGYAKVPVSVRREWGPMVQKYLNTRSTHILTLLLCDIRRDPNEEDILMLEWASQQEKALILVLTKVDKVSKNERHARTQKILKAFKAENLHYIHYSVPKRIGRQELISTLKDALQDEGWDK